MCDVNGKNPCDEVKFEVYFVVVEEVDKNKIVKPKYKIIIFF